MTAQWLPRQFRLRASRCHRPWTRRRQAHDRLHDWITVRRGYLQPVSPHPDGSPHWCVPRAHYSLPALLRKLRFLSDGQISNGPPRSATMPIDARRRPPSGADMRWLESLRICATLGWNLFWTPTCLPGFSGGAPYSELEHARHESCDRTRSAADFAASFSSNAVVSRPRSGREEGSPDCARCTATAVLLLCEPPQTGILTVMAAAMAAGLAG